MADHERPDLTIDVTGSRWEWTFDYPKYGISGQSGEVGDQPLVVPIDEPIRFQLKSDDVIHGFWIPAVDFKRDAIPGIVQKFTLEFDRVGTSAGSCSEYCGIYHSEMVFKVHALRPASFRAWAASHASNHTATARASS